MPKKSKKFAICDICSKNMDKNTSEHICHDCVRKASDVVMQLPSIDSKQARLLEGKPDKPVHEMGQRVTLRFRSTHILRAWRESAAQRETLPRCYLTMTVLLLSLTGFVYRRNAFPMLFNNATKARNSLPETLEARLTRSRSKFYLHQCTWKMVQ
jgi:hypothetical protein